jgi:anthranilate phosphoribosyltransferase
MAFVSMGVNKAAFSKLAHRIKVGVLDSETVLLQSIALLSSMSAKEAYVGLTPEEIAGLTAATLEIDTIIRIPAKNNVLGIGGMGGDRGYARNGERSKLFSLSTMAALVLANFGTVHKHHSYPNTSKVAGQSAIEAFGALSNQSDPRTLRTIQDQVDLIMTSCHTTRLIHTLSHSLKGETINHVIGPLAIPVDSETPVNAFIGVNDNVHPETIIDSLAILHQKGVQKYSNSVAFCGLDLTQASSEYYSPISYYSKHKLKSAVCIDEVAPPPYLTLAAFLINGVDKGTFVIEPEDFMDNRLLENINIRDLLIPNTPEAIITANIEAINDKSLPKVLYLAMTCALATFTSKHSHKPDALNFNTRRLNQRYLQEAFMESLQVIQSGKAYSKLLEYVRATKNIP